MVVGSIRKYSLVILDVTETLFSDLWGVGDYLILCGRKLFL